jgi:xylan 1,4-beta-xylosidase
MTCIHKDDNCIVLKDDKGGFHGICWNYTRWGEGEEKTTVFSIPVDDGRYCVVRNTVDEQNANPLKIWHDLGEPSSLSKKQKEIILAGAKPGVTTESVTVTEKEMELKIVNGPESVVKFDIYPAEFTVDRGYDYDRVIRGEEADPEETEKK